MTDPIIGIMWNKNEADILDETITKALPLVDHLLISDDDSDDHSWDIIRSHKSSLAYHARRSEQSEHVEADRWQRQHLLDKAVELYGRNVWIQVIESDLIAIDVNLKEQLDNPANLHGIGLWWITLEAVRKEWTPEFEQYPNWDRSIQKIMPDCHILEKAPYTWRPYEGVEFGRKWNPVPHGLDKHGPMMGGEWRVRRPICKPDIPLWGHYNIRGRKHFNSKYRHFDVNSKAKDKRELVAFEIPRTRPEMIFPLTRNAWVERCEKNRRRMLKSLW